MEDCLERCPEYEPGGSTCGLSSFGAWAEGGGEKGRLSFLILVSVL